MDRGIARDQHSMELVTRVDALRECTLTSRGELHVDTIRPCNTMSDAIEGVVDRLD